MFFTAQSRDGFAHQERSHFRASNNRNVNIGAIQTLATGAIQSRRLNEQHRIVAFCVSRSKISANTDLPAETGSGGNMQKLNK